MYCNFPAPTPRLLDRKARIVQPTLVKEFSRAVGTSTPRQHGNCINREAKVILASPQGILRHRLIQKKSDLYSGVHRLFQGGFHDRRQLRLITPSTSIIFPLKDVGIKSHHRFSIWFLIDGISKDESLRN